MGEDYGASKRAAGTSWASSEATRRTMQSNRGRDTVPEILLRRQLFNLGLRYRVNLRVEPTLRRTVDIAFTRSKLAVFVDGCFWHGCPIHGTSPKTNSEFWKSKISATMVRDRETTMALNKLGWTVLRFWEHDDPDASAQRVSEIVRNLQGRPPQQ
jgi:DNA mismatch endonuclease (patch repair protein)